MSTEQVGQNVKSLNSMQKTAEKLSKILKENAHYLSHLCI